MARLHYHVYVPRGMGSREVVIERPISINNRDYMESCGTLAWDGDQFGWQLPEEAYMAAILTPAQVADILGLLNWLNRGEP